MALATKKRWIAGALCFGFFLVIYSLTARARLQATDEVATFATGISLATQGNLTIDELQWLHDQVNLGQPGRGGHLYAKYFPGNVVGTALIYRLTARQPDTPYIWNHKELAPSNTAARLALKLNALLGAVALTALLLALSRCFSWQTALVTVLAVGLGSDWGYQSRGLFSEVGAGAFLMVSLYGAVCDSPTVSSSALALSLLFRPTNLLGLPIWGQTWWGKETRRAVSGLWIGLGLALLGYYNWVRFGSPLNFGYGAEQFTASLLDGLYGVLLSPGRSVFVYSPILLLAPFGAYLLYKKSPRLALACLSTVVGYIIAIATWHSWHGGWSWGSRLLTPIVPLLGFLVAPAIEKAWQTPRLPALVVILVLLGSSIQVATLARDPMRAMLATKEAEPRVISFEDTVYTIQHSWMALQFQSLATWQPCDVDSYTLHQWLGCMR